MFSTNHDDKALYLYLRAARNPKAIQCFIRVAWDRIVVYEAAASTDWAATKQRFKRAVALFQLDQEEADAEEVPPVAPWRIFLAYYFRVKEEPLPSPLPEAFNVKYFGRNALERARQQQDDAVYAALELAYKPPLLSLFNRHFANSGLAFKDVYQEASLALLERNADWERRHTAQLYSSLHQIFFNKAIDALKREQGTKPSPEIQPEESNNSTEFTDSIIDQYLLNVRFGTDDEVEILRQAMAKLKEGCRTLLRLRYYRGFRFREIAEQLGYSTNSMGTRIGRCIDGLRGIINP